MSKTLKMQFGYADTDSTRAYAFEVNDSINNSDIKTGIKAINASLANNTAGGLSSFFLSDDGDNFVSIVSAGIYSTVEEPLDISGGDS